MKFLNIEREYKELISVIPENLIPIYQIGSEECFWGRIFNMAASFFPEIVFEKPPNLQRIHELISVLFSLLLIVKSWNLHKLHKLTSSFKLQLIGKFGYISYRLTRMLMSQNVDNDVTMNPPIKTGRHVSMCN